MATPTTGFTNKPSYKPLKPAFAGGASGPAAPKGSPAPKTNPPKPTTAAGPVKDLNLWGTIREIKVQLKDEPTKNVLKALALKYLPDLTMSAFFAIPVVGWAAGLIGIPLNMFLTKKGTEQLITAEKKLDSNNLTHKGLKHVLKLETDRKENNIWASENRYFGKPKEGKKLHELAHYIAIKYNKALEGIFHKSESLQKKLRINREGNSFAFRTLQRFIHARQSLRQTAFVGWLFNKMSGLTRGPMQSSIPKPKIVQLLLLLPRMGLLGLFFIIGKKPNPKAFKDVIAKSV